jgi:D-beta-D-heptose 7-phosphate kinase/D-beta-D-heptose 1-phosphate adenosyltransferase
MTTVAISGGFDPIHIGHIEMMQEAKALGDKLIVIVNNDNWIKKKKGFPFMDEKERKAIIEAIKYVDEVFLTSHAENTNGAYEMSVAKDLERIKPDIFANGGDRDEKNATDPNSSLYHDIEACKKLGIKMVYNIGKSGKIQSSSWLIKKAKENSK